MASVLVVCAFIVALATVVRIGLRDTQITTSKYLMNKTIKDRK